MPLIAWKLKSGEKGWWGLVW